MNDIIPRHPIINNLLGKLVEGIGGILFGSQSGPGAMGRGGEEDEEEGVNGEMEERGGGEERGG